MGVVVIAMFSSCSTERALWRNWAWSERSWEPRWRAGAESVSTSTRPKRDWRPIWLCATTNSTPCTWRSVSFSLRLRVHALSCLRERGSELLFAAKTFVLKQRFKSRKKQRIKCQHMRFYLKKILLPMFFLCLGSKQGSLNSAAESWNENSWTEAPENAGTGVMACLCASLMSLHDVNFEIGFLKAYFLQFALSCTSDLSYNFVI